MDDKSPEIQNCINDSNTECCKCVIVKAGQSLLSFDEGDTVCITGYDNCSHRTRLCNMGLGIGVVLEIVLNSPRKPIIVFARGARLALSRKLASEIMGVRNETH